MVLAAGRGRRMRPLSDDVPKPALPVLDRPLIAWAVDQALSSGVAGLTVNTWHLAGHMERAVRSLGLGDRLRISREDRLMDTAGGLALARERGLLGDSGPVLVLNGDCLYGLDLKPLIEAHLSRERRVTLGLLPHLDPERWARVELTSDGRVAAINPPGRPKVAEVPFLYPGVMVVSRPALNAVPCEPGGIAEALWEPAMEREALGGVIVGGHWLEVGTPEAYRRAVLSRVGSARWVAPDARVDTAASLGSCVIGPGVVVERGAVVAASLVSDGAVVRRDARVVESVLLGPVETEPGERVVGRVRSAPTIC